MANHSGSTPHPFEEDELRHLLIREVQRSTRYQDFLCLWLVRVTDPGSRMPETRAALARQIAELLRATDIVGAIGPDIAVILVHTPESEAVAIADRVRDRVQRTSQVTVSFGLASFPTDATTDAGLIVHAQAQLEAAQQAG